MLTRSSTETIVENEYDTRQNFFGELRNCEAECCSAETAVTMCIGRECFQLRRCALDRPRGFMCLGHVAALKQLMYLFTTDTFISHKLALFSGWNV